MFTLRAQMALIFALCNMGLPGILEMILGLGTLAPGSQI
jgi:hypothetical protein